jgi:phosphate starvation-inducible protein PhoH and related proteins
MSVRKSKSSTTQSVDSKKSVDQTYFNLQKISIELKCKNESQKNLIKLINENTITICAGRAGTGKTFIACAQALKLLKTEKYKKILLVKSVTELEGESLGYIKGSLEEKMYNHTLSYLDNFHKIIGEDNTKKMLEMGYIEVLPLAFIRGRSIDDSIIIVDEAQNITLSNMRSTLTRIGDNSKMIITGDSKQVDIKNKKQSSLDIVVNIFKDKEGIGTMYFTTSDIVRSSIVRMVEDEFDIYEEMMIE